ncbi:hypothetical protein KQ247_14895 [Ruegeria pomeroyi]|uniref:Lipoprotein, putative n=2 Tax=Ruegeria pomeroyi TaxID=89184 RepID=Q5LU32_RUEPO|nr:lipoprotein [Ruegeria pomeroyi]AAV94521.1 lipoprotein, putative [Ruegeria pomeroyi DSS-3]NVK99286.1 hypothetical protein [Ruegeria pomeroyi]NVL01450.1 hypothetical protein [Ruegeria pomeroyi]QWV08103.1 hypothetical protein KQ247_14895 [Ruegeria pomeroyi]
MFRSIALFSFFMALVTTQGCSEDISNSETHNSASPMSNSQSGKFSLSNNGKVGCTIEFNGEIELGETDRMMAFFKSLADDNPFDASFFNGAGFSNPSRYSEMKTEYGFEFFWEDGELTLLNQSGLSICLNSSGGSFSEAVQMYDAIKGLGLGTVVPERARCLSACAVVFLGGRMKHWTTMGGNLVTQKRRSLHATAELGVHAPSIEFELDELDEALPPEVLSELITSSYSAAVNENAQLISRLSDNELPILRRILATSPETMYLFNTVERTLEVEMEILGIRVPKSVVANHVKSSCENAALAFIGIASNYEQLGHPRNVGPWHWQCEKPSLDTYSVKSARVLETARTNSGLIAGIMDMPSIECWEPGHRNYCIAVYSEILNEESPPALEGYGVSVGFWFQENGRPTSLADFVESSQAESEDTAAPFFVWDGGSELLYSPSTQLRKVSE